MSKTRSGGRILDVDITTEKDVVASMMGGPDKSQEVWTYQYQPFRLGQGLKLGMMFPVKCWAAGEVVDLLYGYQGFVFQNTQHPGSWHVALRDGGALVGHGKSKHEAIADVLKDMRGGNKKLMKDQVELSKRVCKEAQRVARRDFMQKVGRGSK